MSKSPLDDSLTVALSIAATSGPSNSIGGTQSSRLIIRCQEHSTEFYIALDEYLGSGSADVVYRIDNAPSQSDSWSKSTDAPKGSNCVCLEVKQDSTGEPKWVPNFVRDGEAETPKLPPRNAAHLCPFS